LWRLSLLFQHPLVKQLPLALVACPHPGQLGLAWGAFAGMVGFLSEVADWAAVSRRPVM
jgi:hypothetical protein